MNRTLPSIIRYFLNEKNFRIPLASLKLKTCGNNPGLIKNQDRMGGREDQEAQKNDDEKWIDHFDLKPLI